MCSLYYSCGGKTMIEMVQYNNLQQTFSPIPCWITISSEKKLKLIGKGSTIRLNSTQIQAHFPPRPHLIFTVCCITGTTSWTECIPHFVPCQIGDPHFLFILLLLAMTFYPSSFQHIETFSSTQCSFIVLCSLHRSKPPPLYLLFCLLSSKSFIKSWWCTLIIKHFKATRWHIFGYFSSFTHW